METLQRTANRGSISTGYDIDNSLKLEADNGEVLTQTIGAGSRTTATYSFWFKRTELGASMQLAGISPIGSETTRFLITSNDVLDVESGVGGDNNSLVTNRVFRDTSAWYHFVVAIDTTQATEANRVKVYINGVQETSFSASEYPAQDTNLTIGVSGYTWSWGAYSSTLIKSSGYLAEAYYIDAQQLDPTSFGEFDEDTGIWKPIAYTGSFGSNGHYLDFSDASNLGNNLSGVGSDFTPTNITSADQATDTPTNNFCTLNPLVQYLPDGAYSFISEGATKARSTQFDVYYTYAPTFGVTSGKWYAEFEYEGSQADNLVGILDIDAVVSYNKRLGETGQWSVGLNQSNGTLFVTSDSGVTSTASWGASAADGDIISVAVDMDNYFVYFAKNGTWQNSGVPTSGASGTGGVAFDSNKTVGIGCSTYSGAADGIIFTNLGGYTAGTISSAATDENGYGTFEYAPPSGYYALCTKNLAEYG